LMLSYDKVPFTCTFLPGENMKAVVPILALAFLIGAATFARIELGIVTGRYPAAGVAALIALYVALRIASRMRPRVADIDFNEVPVSVYQLGLYD